MSINYACLNDTAIAHIFSRIITKTNLPYNKNILTLEEFNNDYNIIKGYIEWHKINHIEKKFSLYNLTQNNMIEIMNLINYNVDNKDELQKFWRTKICNINI